jgi:TPR repeat protein
MKAWWWVAWSLVGTSVFLQGAAMASAQQEEAPILKPKPRAAATLLVMCDLACNWNLDGEIKGRIDAGGSAKAKVELGQHALAAVTDDGLDKVEKDIEIKTAGQTIFRVELQPVRNDRIQAQQDADPVYLRDHAAERAKEGQELYDQKHFEEAKPILKKACTGGEMTACVTLGDILVHENDLGTDTHKNFLVARSLYQKACDSGVMSGCTSLGDTYNYGNDSDYNKASSLFQKACVGGDMWGCNNLATEYLFGHGEPKDRSRALDLYQKACRGGFDWACHQLSDLQYPSQ